MAELTDIYLRTIGRLVGIPEMWIEDYIQEVRLLAWLKPSPLPKIQAKNKAIDFARHFGPYSQRRVHHEAETIEGNVEVPRVQARTPSEDVICALLDAAAVIAELPLYQRRALARRVYGLPMSDSDSVAAARARKKLRKLKTPPGG